MLGLCDDEPQQVRDNLERSSERLPRGAFLIQHYYALWAECQLDLYSGDGAAALGRLEVAWPALRRSLLLRVQAVRIQLFEQHARAALTAAASRASPARARDDLLADVERTIRKIDRERVAWAEAVATALRASLATARGDAPGAIALWKDAEARLLERNMSLYAASCRYRRGVITSGTAGEELLQEAEERFRAEGVRNVAKMVSLYTAGPRRA
jgi:hypothetical protein